MTQATATLNDVLADTLESRYIDDSYYDLLRDDLVEWKQLGASLTEQERARYEQVVIDENWLLDQREFERCISFFRAVAAIGRSQTSTCQIQARGIRSDR